MGNENKLVDHLELLDYQIMETLKDPRDEKIIRENIIKSDAKRKAEKRAKTREKIRRNYIDDIETHLYDLLVLDNKLHEGSNPQRLEMTNILLEGFTEKLRVSFTNFDMVSDLYDKTRKDVESAYKAVGIKYDYTMSMTPHVNALELEEDVDIFSESGNVNFKTYLKDTNLMCYSDMTRLFPGKGIFKLTSNLVSGIRKVMKNECLAITNEDPSVIQYYEKQIYSIASRHLRNGATFTSKADIEKSQEFLFGLLAKLDASGMMYKAIQGKKIGIDDLEDVFDKMNRNPVEKFPDIKKEIDSQYASSKTK